MDKEMEKLNEKVFGVNKKKHNKPNKNVVKQKKRDEDRLVTKAEFEKAMKLFENMINKRT